MIKKIIYNFLIIILVFPIIVNASSNTIAKVGNNYYDTLSDAIKNSNNNDTIKLLSNVISTESFDINKTVNIDLNGNNILAPSNVFVVKGGVLNLSGNGTIRETEPNYGAIKVMGSSNPTDNDYSIVNIGENVKLEGWSGVFITHESSKSYGVVVNLFGKINAISDVNGGTGIGIYVNGNIKDETNSPIVNIKDGAEITSNGNGLYIAGYSKFNIGDAFISGDESGIGIKSGILNINGANIISEGLDKTPTEGYNNGIYPSGTAIQIESNTGYSGNIELNIKDGYLRSKNSHTIYEYIGKGNSTKVKDINLSGGTYVTESNKSTLYFSDSFKDKHNKFITGGKYRTDIKEYLASGYSTTIEDEYYVVSKSTMKEIILYNSNGTKKSYGKIITIIIVSIITLVLVYLNRNKLINLVKR
ncbi:MAG: hypothetical protein IJD92_03705 [Bacilli bacterium]|nr:hypothetical protein [Bacilli bacterium]